MLSGWSQKDPTYRRSLEESDSQRRWWESGGRGLAAGAGSECFTGTELRFGKMEVVVVTAAQQWGALNATELRANGRQDGNRMCHAPYHPARWPRKLGKRLVWEPSSGEPSSGSPHLGSPHPGTEVESGLPWVSGSEEPPTPGSLEPQIHEAPSNQGGSSARVSAPLFSLTVCRRSASSFCLSGARSPDSSCRAAWMSPACGSWNMLRKQLMSLTSATRSGDTQKSRQSLAHRPGKARRCGHCRRVTRALRRPPSLGALPNLSAVPTDEPGPLGLEPGAHPSDWKGRGRASENRGPHATAAFLLGLFSKQHPRSLHPREPSLSGASVTVPRPPGAFPHTRGSAKPPSKHSGPSAAVPRSAAHVEATRPEHCGLRGRPGDSGPLCAHIDTTRP